MSNRQRGDAFERRCADTLRSLGWFVIRAGGSLGIADLVALRDGCTPLFVSCKLSGRIDPAERADLYDAARRAGARPLVASRPKGGWVDLRAVTPQAPKPLTTIDGSPYRMPPRPRKGHDDDTSLAHDPGDVPMPHLRGRVG